MLYIYLIISAAAIPLLNNFFDILKEPYSWWLVPLLFIGFFLCFLLIQFAAFFLMIVTTNLDKPARHTKLFRFLVKECVPVIVKLALVKIKTEGIEKLPKDGRMLFVCNHQHDFDPVVMINTFPDSDIAFIGKKEIYTTRPIIARAMHRLNSLPIDRENDREAAKTIVQAIKYIREDKVSMAVFPEGYCSKTCELLPFRNGCFKMATKTNVPIVVCVINNTRTLPKTIFRKPNQVVFKLLDVITPEQYEGMNTTEIGDMIYEKINTALKEIRNT